MHRVEFDELQKDAVVELINNGMGRAANALAIMINEEVLLTVPNVEFISFEELGHYYC